MSTSAAEQVRHRRLVEPVTRAGGDQRRQGSAASVHGELVEQRLLVRVQEVVAPLHEPSESVAHRRRRPACRRSSASRRSTIESSSESPSTLTRAAASSIASGSPSTRRAISAAIERSLGGQLEVRSGRTRAGGEQLHGRRVAVVSRLPGRATGAARRVTSDLAGDAKHLAARREHPHVGDTPPARPTTTRAASSSACSQASSTSSGVAVTQARDDARERVGAACVDRLSDQADDVGRAARARKLDQPHPVANLALEHARRLEREPALADARRPGERHQPVLAQQLDDLGELPLAADERGRRAGQVAAAARCNRHGGDRRILRENRLPGAIAAQAPARARARPRARRRASWKVSSASAWRPLR